VKPLAGITPTRFPTVAKRELEMALSLIEGFSGEWDPTKYRDTYTNALRKVVNAKLKGKEIHSAPEIEDEEAPDIMEALRLSLEEIRQDKTP
jgi:DNA end-binding protein Ku